MPLLYRTSVSELIVTDYFFVAIIIIALIIGLLVGYVIGKKKNYPKWDNRRQHYPNKKIKRFSKRSERYTFLRVKKRWLRHRKGIIFTIIWILVLFFVLPALEFMFGKFIIDISALFILISFIIGFYNAYPVTMWIERQIPNTEFGIWIRRGVAGILMVGGFGLGILWLLSSMMATASLAFKGVTSGPFISMMALTVLIASFFLGLAVFAGYIEFTFERKAGILIFHGRQRF